MMSDMLVVMRSINSLEQLVNFNDCRLLAHCLQKVRGVICGDSILLSEDVLHLDYAHTSVLCHSAR